MAVKDNFLEVCLSFLKKNATCSKTFISYLDIRFPCWLVSLNLSPSFFFIFFHAESSLWHTQASLVAGLRFRLRSHGMWAQLPCRMWNLSTPDQQSNPSPLHRKADSQSLDQQRIPPSFVLTVVKPCIIILPFCPHIMSSVQIPTNSHLTGGQVLQFFLRYKTC